MLLNYAVELDMIASNPAVGVKRYEEQEGGLPHLDRSRDGAVRGEASRSAPPRGWHFTLALYTSQRVSDVVRMGWQHVKGDRIAVRQEKTDKPLVIPMHPELVQVLASVSEGNLTFLLTERGAPFTPAGLRIGSASGATRLACNIAAPMGCASSRLRGWQTPARAPT